MGGFEVETPVSVGAVLKYHPPGVFEVLTQTRNPAGDRMVGSLTGAVSPPKSNGGVRRLPRVRSEID